MKNHALFFLKIRTDVTKFVVCSSLDLLFKGCSYLFTGTLANSNEPDVCKAKNKSSWQKCIII